MKERTVGYTSYWRQPGRASDSEWKRFLKDARSILTYPRVQAIVDVEEEPHQIGPDRICFNGRGDEAYETFSISPGPRDFEFCKTARKPYDAVVCAILILAAEIFGTKIQVSSDGDWDREHEWGRGAVLFEEVLRRKAKNPFRDRSTRRARPSITPGSS